MEQRYCYNCMNTFSGSVFCPHCGHDQRTPNAPHQLPPGTILRRQYMIGRVLGQGGFGITYLGLDLALDMPVAIKEYFPSGMVTREAGINPTVSLVTSSDDHRFAENRDRFLREARTLAKLRDVPEVVQVLSFFEANSTAYIVMGYVQGITLKEHIRRRGGHLTPDETFQLLLPLMEGLEQVHKSGLVHRDISPDNIMLQSNQRARLIDFGAAHAATGSMDKSTQAVLKHGFAPMEQYQTKGNLGPWTDVYAICATIYRCLTGLMPPSATDRVMGSDDFSWTALSSLTPSQLDALKHGLALKLEDRIQSVEELRRRLSAYAAPVPACSPIPPSVMETVPVYTPPIVPQPEPIYTAPVIHAAAPIYTAPVVPEPPPIPAPDSGSQSNTDTDSGHETDNSQIVLLLFIGALVLFLALMWAIS